MTKCLWINTYFLPVHSMLSTLYTLWYTYRLLLKKGSELVFRLELLWVCWKLLQFGGEGICCQPPPEQWGRNTDMLPEKKGSLRLTETSVEAYWRGFAWHKIPIGMKLICKKLTKRTSTVPAHKQVLSNFRDLADVFLEQVRNHLTLHQGYN